MRTPYDDAGTPARARAVVCWVIFVVLGIAALLTASPTAAQEPTGTSTTTTTTTTTAAGGGGTAVTGTLTVERDGEDGGVSGVRITATSPSGSEAGEATSADDGTWMIPLAEAGQYTITIDPDSLPEGVFLSQPDQTTREVSVTPGRSRPILFGLTTQEGGEQDASGPSTFGSLLDLTVDGIRFGLIIATASMGLSLVFGVTGLINFAHGELVTLGAIIAYVLNTTFGVTLILAGIIAIVIMGGVGAAMEMGLHRPLRRRRLGNVALIVVTIGLGEFLRNLYIVLFGVLPRPYETYAIQQKIQLGPVGILPKDLGSILVATIALVATALLLQRTRMGTAMRAVADNKDLAAASGINTQRVILHAWVLGTTLAALGGILLGVSQKVQWNMGFNFLLLMFAAVVLGGLGTAYGPVVGGLLLGIVTQVSTLWFDTEFKFVFALGTLILMLLFRPQGMLGRRERIG